MGWRLGSGLVMDTDMTEGVFLRELQEVVTLG